MRRSVAIFKTLSFSFLFCLLCAGNYCEAQTMPSVAPSQLVLPDSDIELKLVWGGDSINGKWDPYASLLIPVKVPGCPREFYMQFDLGAHSSLFYRDKLKAIGEKYPDALYVSDSTNNKLYNFSFRSGKAKISAKEIQVRAFEQSPVSWDKKSIIIIGTLGADLIDNKVAVINYPGKKLLISNSVPSKLQSRVDLADFMLAGRSVLLPAIIKGKKTMLYFDTGSSTFELITDRATSLSLSAPGAVADKYPVNSWGKQMTANTVPSNDSIEIASKKIPLYHVTYFEGFSDSQAAQMMQMGMGGMTGNRLFLNSVLVLDTKNKKFGVISY
jgi:hypothetical protein